MMENEISKAERTRRFIIETTAAIFNKKGFAGTSLSDLTKATGLTKGSIYGNFENKEEVALAVFDYNHSKISQIIQQHIQRAGTFAEKLMVYAEVYHNFKSSLFVEGGCPILNTAVEADDTNNLLKDKASKAILKWKKTISDLIEGGIQAGEFKKDVDQSQIALSIIALIEGGIMIGKVTNNTSNLDQILKTVEQIIARMKV